MFSDINYVYSRLIFFFFSLFIENFTFSNETVSFLCAKKTVEKLYDNLMFLPQPLKYALICLDAHIINYMPEILPAEGSVYIQVIKNTCIS